MLRLSDVSLYIDVMQLSVLGGLQSNTVTLKKPTFRGNVLDTVLISDAPVNPLILIDCGKMFKPHMYAPLIDTHE